jgi:hypothetical protein
MVLEPLKNDLLVGALVRLDGRDFLVAAFIGRPNDLSGKIDEDELGQFELMSVSLQANRSFSASDDVDRRADQIG